VKATLGTVGPFALPLALVAGAVALANLKPAQSFDEVLRPLPGVLRIAIPANPPNLDPVEATDTTSDGVLERMGATLLRFDPDLKLVPDTAEAVPEPDATGTTYTFRLREGVRFHSWTDSAGVLRPEREVTAEDVRYSLVRLLEPWSKRSYFLTGVVGMADARKALSGKRDRKDVEQPPVAGIEVVDARTIRIRLEERNRYFLYFLAMNNAMIVPKEAVKDLGYRFGRSPVSAGPFRLVEWRDNHKVVFERFEAYFGRRSPLDRVVFYVVPGEETAFQAYLNGDVDIIQAPYGKLKSIRASNLSSQLTLNPLGDVRFHGFNMERAPLGGNTEKADPKGDVSKGAPPVVPMTAEDKARARKLRQAFNYAIDRKALISGILEDRAVPAKGVVPPGMQGYNPDLVGYSYDPEKARKLLAEAGYPNGDGLPEIPYHFNSQPPNAEVAQYIQADLARVGIRTRLHQLDWGAYQNYVDESRTQFFRMAWILDYPEAENFLYPLFHSKFLGSDGNYARTNNPEIDRLLDEARACTDIGAEMKGWRKAEEAIVEEAPWLFLYHSASGIMVKPYVKGVVFTRMDAGPEIQQVDLSQVTIEGGAE
jgi:oligopeptide transport system substrate-binding protein